MFAEAEVNPTPEQTTTVRTSNLEFVMLHPDFGAPRESAELDLELLNGKKEDLQAGAGS